MLKVLQKNNKRPIHILNRSPNNYLIIKHVKKFNQYINTKDQLLFSTTCWVLETVLKWTNSHEWEK